MRRVFADTAYWIALANPRDQWHARAVEASKALGEASLVTTDEVLSEFLTHHGARGPLIRSAGVRYVESILIDPAIQVRPQSRETFLAGFALYRSRLDKEYSLIDCISMDAMRAESIVEILTHDAHFRQEGFITLF